MSLLSAKALPRLALLLAGLALCTPSLAQTDPVRDGAAETTPVDRADGEVQDEAWADDGWADDTAVDDEWGDDWGDSWEEEEAGSPWVGFVELGFGSRWREDPAVGRYATLGELRWRIERSWEPGKSRIDLRADLVGDAVLDEFDAELRELAWGVPLGNTDLRIGRQVLTWGTGDLVFLNDLFPKGWVSFFIGRDDEYLKQPSNAIRVTSYTDWVNIDLVAMPIFAPDEYLTGARLSFFSPQAGMIVAPDPPLDAQEPSTSLSNTEWALRLFRTIGSNELALYGYSGFYLQPSQPGPDLPLIFPEIRSLGASWRRTLGPGLFNAEVSRYWSLDNPDGTNAYLPNDQYRFLLGYEWEAARNLTVGFQYYMEWTLDYDALLENSPWPQFEQPERLTWLTNRLTWRTRQDRLIWSLFTYWSPNDDDGYLRPQVSWRISDVWNLSAGGNVFFGKEDYSFFGQFQDDSNLYARLRFNY